MTKQPIRERVWLASLAAADGVDRLRGAAGRGWRKVTSVGLRTPARLLLAPPDIRTADPTVATDIYAGYFSFAGKTVSTHGRPVFELPVPSLAWGAGLASFGWLRHLRAADTALARANARVLVDDWLLQNDKRPERFAWEPAVVARRMLSWLSQSPLILQDADRLFYRRFMKSLARHAVALQCVAGRGTPGETRLLALIALTQFGLCAEGIDALQRRATRLLVEELRRQILPDGGHISRNPQQSVDLLLDLLPLRQSYAARGLDPPQELMNAIDRTTPYLRLLRLGDGSLALFNGMGVTAHHQLAIVLAYEDARSAAMINAPHSGYQRLESGDAILVMDTGRSPPLEFSTRAHAGTLAFELSSEGQKIIANCGAPDDGRNAMRIAARATAAHSTLVLGDMSSSRFAGLGLDRFLAGRILSGPTDCAVTRYQDAGGAHLSASHDGYKLRFGLAHRRTLHLSGDGFSLTGEDALAEAPGAVETARDLDYVLRFHLPANVRASVAEGGTRIALTMPDGAAWLFQCEMPADIEESIAFAGREGTRAAQQIAVHVKTRDTLIVTWRLFRET